MASRFLILYVYVYISCVKVFFVRTGRRPTNAIDGVCYRIRRHDGSMPGVRRQSFWFPLWCTFVWRLQGKLNYFICFIMYCLLVSYLLYVYGVSGFPWKDKPRSLTASTSYRCTRDITGRSVWVNMISLGFYSTQLNCW